MRILELHSRSLLAGNRIGIRDNLMFKEIIFELAYELAHAIIHCDEGNMIESPLRSCYDIQAEKAAVMIIDLINHKFKNGY